MGADCDIADQLFGDGDRMMLALLVFLADRDAGVLRHGGRCACAARSSAAPPASPASATRRRPAAAARCAIRASKAAQRVHRIHHQALLVAATRGNKVLRRRMIQAGIFDARAVGYFFLGRAALAVGAGALLFFFVPMLSAASTAFWLLDRRRRHPRLSRRRASISTSASRRARSEHRSGFPDFMDLLVVCADAGLSMEASLERVGRELGDSYPSLYRQHPHDQSRNPRRPHHDRGARASRRPARPRRGALVRDADPAIGRARLQHHRCAAGLFATTCATSGCRAPRRRPTACRPSSSVPMMVCIFPVLFVVILLPVFVRIKMGAY